MDKKISEHRFYYSASQDKLIEDMRCFDDVDDGKSTYVRLDDKNLVRYTEWCSSKDSKSNWDDAVIVYETNDPEYEVLKRIVRV
jgi:hypothetical protein